jgi:hypothetical protein
VEMENEHGKERRVHKWGIERRTDEEGKTKK